MAVAGFCGWVGVAAVALLLAFVAGCLAALLEYALRSLLLLP